MHASRLSVNGDQVAVAGAEVVVARPAISVVLRGLPAEGEAVLHLDDQEPPADERLVRCVQVRRGRRLCLSACRRQLLELPLHVFAQLVARPADEPRRACSSSAGASCTGISITSTFAATCCDALLDRVEARAEDRAERRAAVGDTPPPPRRFAPAARRRRRGRSSPRRRGA